MKVRIKQLDSRQSSISRLLVILFAFAILYLSDIFLEEKLVWYFKIPLNLLLVAITYFAFSFGKEVRIQNSKLKYGSYYLLFQNFKSITEINLEDIEEIEIYQNAENYFEIVASSRFEKIVIKEIANKNPAKIELEKIKTLIQNIC